ncbi:2'-5' RNA ligase [Halospina denitrificans]|uniref:RNA 2',3'-cyclic phosphodiesterase n=1 Tax=Halospina denitrificans TaxID=332522 RepID=A0A4R7JYB5_9GAMM|nr:RNA 2',3'-cyclic phosphodiesterase [Halospina denitrificans]TDT43066.1 2'-5' RNA ligase [Halospina denitrificans]
MTSDNIRSGKKKIRSFLATPVPEALAAALMESAEVARKDLPSLGVTARDNLHLTLVFLGNLTEEQLDNTVIPRVTEIVDEATPGWVYFHQLAGFPSEQRPRHLVLEGDASPSAEMLQESLRQGLQDLIGNQEPRAWRPHITLGRFRKNGGPGITPTLWQAELPIGEVCLYESQTTPQGPVYRIRHRWSPGQPAG